MKNIFKKIIRFKLISLILRVFNPRYSYCRICGLPYNCCKLKTVNYSERSGTFATCDYCWENSTLRKIENCYIDVYYYQNYQYYICGKEIDHSIFDLLNAVEKEYYKTHNNH